MITLESSASEITTKVSKMGNKLTDFHTRMDDDFDLWNLDEETFDKHTNAINVCTPDPRNFADDVMSTMSRAAMQIVVRLAEGTGQKKEAAKLERLLVFAFEKADELLARKLYPPFRESVIWYGMLRGWRAGRIFVKTDNNGKVVFDFMPWDMRWVTYEPGANGLLSGAYKTFRTEESLIDEYGTAPKSSILKQMVQKIPFVTPKNTYEVIDYWGIPDVKKPKEILNAVVSGDTFLKKPEIFDLPSMPISIRPVATRPPIASDDSAVALGYGDSIYAPNRDTYELINKLYSIEATRAQLLSKQPVINYYKAGGQTGLKDTVLQAEAVIDVPEETNRLEPMPMKEISVTLMDMLSKLESKRERGEVPRLEISKPPPSGTLYSLVQEASAKVYVPQLRNLSLFYADICKLVEEQLIAGKLKVDVESEIRQNYYKVKVTPVDLKKPHTIHVEFSDRTPWTSLEVAQHADMLKRQGVPDEFIWEYIYKFPDPMGMKDMAAKEIVEHSPKLIRLRGIKALLDEDRRDEARVLIEELFAEQMQQQTAMPQAQTPETPPPEVTTA